jgi:hypothetical protein
MVGDKANMKAMIADETGAGYEEVIQKERTTDTMKTLLSTFALILLVSSSQAQSGTHDYIWMTFVGPARILEIASTLDDTRVVDLKSVGGKDGELDKKSVLEEVVKLEFLGWELVDLEITGTQYVWIMRKPKQ